MTTMHISDLFQKTMIATIVGLCISQSSIALEVLSDEHLGQTTGEGIAFLPQDFYFMYRGAGANESKTELFSDRSKDTGYINIKPVGPLTTVSLDTNKDGKVDGSDHSVGKADIYLYGLSLSRTDKDFRNRIAKSESAASIRNWGSPDNPWVIKASTESNVPNFSSKACTGGADAACRVSYLGLEAPLYATNQVGDDYDLKFAFWADAFVLDQSKKSDSSQLYHLGEKMGQSDANRSNRLRLQAILDDFSINGSRLQIFQTLNGASNSNGMSVFYNNTLGIAALVRINSGNSKDAWVGRQSYRILRLSTAETSNSNNLNSPAINGGAAPVFKDNEGIFLEYLNFNMVLGSLYQPIVVSSDGRNFSLELARIPNKPEIYNKVYINYDKPLNNQGQFSGSICNYYKCGSNGPAGYQGNNVTHGSIAFGDVNYDSNTNRIYANNSAERIKGITFGAPHLIGGAVNNNATRMGSGVIDGILIQHLKVTSTGL